MIGQLGQCHVGDSENGYFVPRVIKCLETESKRFRDESFRLRNSGRLLDRNKTKPTVSDVVVGAVVGRTIGWDAFLNYSNAAGIAIKRHYI
jgi:hypothetical protein